MTHEHHDQKHEHHDQKHEHHDQKHEHHDQKHATATDDFERALTALLLQSYGDGARVEGTWEITSPVSVVPEWTVTIEKTATDGPETYEPSFLEE